MLSKGSLLLRLPGPAGRPHAVPTLGTLQRPAQALGEDLLGKGSAVWEGTRAPSPPRRAAGQGGSAAGRLRSPGLIPLLFAVKAAGGLTLSMSRERRELVLGTGLPLGHVVHHRVPLRSRPRFSAARVSPACSRSGKRQGPALAPPLWGLLEEAGVERHDVDEQGNREAG